jgi:hypothetical protein
MFCMVIIVGCFYTGAWDGGRGRTALAPSLELRNVSLELRNVSLELRNVS